jgi:subtilisin family serine protease
VPDTELISGGGGPIAHQVEALRMSAAAAAEEARAANVVGAVMKMPLMLIQGLGPAEAGPPGDDWALRQIGADTSPWSGEGVTVAVLDTGIDATHEAFEGIDITQQNFTTDAAEDTDGHGTHCAGTIFGRNVGERRIGVARGVTKALIGKIIGLNSPADTDVVARALNWAMMNRADVISMSIGMDFPGFRDQLIAKYKLDGRAATSLALDAYRANMMLFDELSRGALGAPGLTSGSVVVCAAGNESDSPRYTISSSPPGNAAEFVSVAALARPIEGKPRLAPFSNVRAKLAAPGVGIVSARRGGGLKNLDGTSMATPYVAGIACLWLEKLRKQGRISDSRNVIEQLRRSAVSLMPHVREEHVLWGQAYAPQD